MKITFLVSFMFTIVTFFATPLSLLIVFISLQNADKLSVPLTKITLKPLKHGYLFQNEFSNSAIIREMSSTNGHSLFKIREPRMS